MNDFTKLAREFLNSELVGHLSTAALAGTAWGCTLEFVNDDNFTFYWRSDATSRHSQNLKENPSCALVVTKLDAQNKGIGIQAGGTAKKIEDPSLISQLRDRIDQKRGKQMSSEIQKQEDEREYWALTPKELFYIDEPLLGYERVRLMP